MFICGCTLTIARTPEAVHLCVLCNGNSHSKAEDMSGNPDKLLGPTVNSACVEGNSQTFQSLATNPANQLVRNVEYTKENMLRVKRIEL